jgi:hypothetical protein
MDWEKELRRESKARLTPISDASLWLFQILKRFPVYIGQDLFHHCRNQIIRKNAHQKEREWRKEHGRQGHRIII